MTLSPKFNAILLGLTLLLTAGCSKNEALQDTPAPETSAQKTCQLIGESSAGSARYTYNSNGTVDEIHAHAGGSYTKYFYNAAGNITEGRTYDANNTLTYVETITYNSNNLPESRFSTPVPNSNPALIMISKYYYNAANHLEKQTYHMGDTVTTALDVYSYPAANQVTIKGYGPVAYTTGFQLGYTRHNYYDNMKHPGTHLGYLKHDILLSKHNLTRIVHTDHAANTTLTMNYSYQYNEEGYPVYRLGDAGGVHGYSWTYNCQ